VRTSEKAFEPNGLPRNLLGAFFKHAANGLLRSPHGIRGQATWPGRIRRRLVQLRQPVVIFGIALVTLVWISTEALIDQQRKSIHEAIIADARNLTVVLDREVVHTINDLDRILLFIRSTRDRNPQLDWQSIITDKYNVDSQTVQIAVIDADGIMVTSSALLHPEKLIDLHDREHFVAQRDSKTDALFISKPMVGRASGKLSVQFSRKLLDANGAFAGVIVVSLDAEMLTRAYSGVNLGAGNGLALIGDDGVARSGTGIFADVVGKTFPGSDDLAEFFAKDVGSKLAIDRDDIVEVLKCVEGYPLNVVVALPGIAANGLLASNTNTYRWSAAAASFLVLLATVSAWLRRYRYERRMLRMAKFDSLTNLPNRAHLQDELEAVFTVPSEKRNFALHVVDLDGFKFINDTYGHLTGDELLKIVADRLTAIANRGEFVARLGGDEFAIVQPVKNFAKDATLLAERVISGLSAPCRIGGVEATVGASVGFASARNDGRSAYELLQAADLALYAVKTSGRRASRCYDPDMTLQMRKRVATECGLRRAVEFGEFVVFYQPIVNAATNRTVGYEALVRWNHPERGVVGPDEFISVAEETGLIVPLGEWVFHRACKEVARLGGDLRVAVNCSPRQFAGDGIVDVVRSALAASGLRPDRLEIEITESMLIKEDQSVVRQLNELRAMGCGISLDDFGTGYSSLSYLARYPIDKIKIDRAFIASVADRRRTQAVVRAIVDLATAFGMETIAEGVEDEEQLQILRRLGCVEVQGYLFARPKPIAEFGKLTPVHSASRAA